MRIIDRFHTRNSDRRYFDSMDYYFSITIIYAKHIYISKYINKFVFIYLHLTSKTSPLCHNIFDDKNHSSSQASLFSLLTSLTFITICQLCPYLSPLGSLIHFKSIMRLFSCPFSSNPFLHLSHINHIHEYNHSIKYVFTIIASLLSYYLHMHTL